MPLDERPGSQQPVMGRPQQVAAHPEETLHEALHRHEALHVGNRFESPHLPLALTDWLMRDFRSIVIVLPGAGITDGIAVRCAAE